MSNYFTCLEELQKWMREYGVATVMDDLQLLNPELYKEVEKFFTKETKTKQIAALLRK